MRAPTVAILAVLIFWAQPVSAQDYDWSEMYVGELHEHKVQVGLDARVDVDSEQGWSNLTTYAHQICSLYGRSSWGPISYTGPSNECQTVLNSGLDTDLSCPTYYTFVCATDDPYFD